MTAAWLYHVQVNVSDAATALPFYRALLGHLGFRAVYDEGGVAGFSDGRADLWIMGTPAPHDAAGFHRKRPGLNHVAFGVAARADVDAFHRDFLVARGIPTLYGTPRDFPEYAPSYHAVFFEGPDRPKLEVVHRPAHA